MEAVFLDVLDEGAEGGVDDGFGEAGRAAGVEDVERMRRRQLLEAQGLVRRAVDGIC